MRPVPKQRGCKIGKNGPRGNSYLENYERQNDETTEILDYSAFGKGFESLRPVVTGG
jgi:hypothetical protein